jgi:hypothetical protein
MKSAKFRFRLKNRVYYPNGMLVQKILAFCLAQLLIVSKLIVWGSMIDREARMKSEAGSDLVKRDRIAY